MKKYMDSVTSHLTTSTAPIVPARTAFGQAQGELGTWTDELQRASLGALMRDSNPSERALGWRIFGLRLREGTLIALPSPAEQHQWLVVCRQRGSYARLGYARLAARLCEASGQAMRG